MNWIFRTIIIPADIVDHVRNLGECLHPAAAGMFNTPLSPTGQFPATHYISSGLIEDVWIAPLSDSAILYGAAQQGALSQGLTLNASFDDAVRMIAEGDISEESADVAMLRIGLTMCVEIDQ